MITPEALEAFTKAQVLSPRNLAVRYFLALADLQAGRLQKAYDAWLEIYQQLPAESSDNRQALAEQIRRVAQQLEINPENQLAQTAPLATSLPATRPAPGPDRAAMAQARGQGSGERDSEGLRRRQPRKARKEYGKSPGRYSGKASIHPFSVRSPAAGPNSSSKASSK